MRISFDDAIFLENLRERHIYFLSEKSKVGVPNHYHIVIKRTVGGIVHLVCCTTKKDTILRFLDRQGLPYSTIVWVEPDEVNHLPKDSYINCNSVHSCTEEELVALCKHGYAELRGECGGDRYLEIIRGICDSPVVVEEIKDLLREELVSMD
jgi:hypothetical protein